MTELIIDVLVSAALFASAFISIRSINGDTETIATVEKDTEVTINYELNSWVNITYGNITGWARKYFENYKKNTNKEFTIGFIGVVRYKKQMKMLRNNKSFDNLKYIENKVNKETSVIE